MKFILCLLLIVRCASPALSQTTEGKDFWLGFMYNNALKSNPPNNVVTLEVYVTSKRVTSGTITIPGQSFIQTFNIPANSSKFINIPLSAMSDEDNSFDRTEAKAIHISTCDTVSVYAVNNGRFSSDATVIYPTPSLGTDYRVLTKQSADFTRTYLTPFGYQTYTFPGILRTEFLIVATENNSSIEITPSVWTEGGHAPNVPYTITLNQGEMYLVTSRSFGSSKDLTGTIIKSLSSVSGNCSNFAVFSGIQLLYVGSCEAADDVYEQLSPINTWGKNFLVGKFAEKKGIEFRVLSLNNGTNLSIDGSPMATLNAGQFYDYANSSNVGPLFISANQSILVMQYMQGAECDITVNPPDRIGDPDQVLISPIEQTMKVATFYTIPSSVLTKYYVNVWAKTAAVAGIRLNGNSVASYFTPVPANPLYSYAKGIPLIKNTNYQLVSDTGFCAFVYGMGVDESYTYPVGSSVKDLVNDFTIISPPSLCPAEIWTFQAVSDPSATSYAWDYGDGNTGSGLSASHAYAAEGTYSVTLTKTVTGACPKIVVKYVTVKRPSVKIRGNNTICRGQSTTLWTKIKNDTLVIKRPTACGDTIRQVVISRLDGVRWSTTSQDSSITVSPSVTTTYYIEGYVNGSTCVAKDSFVVNVLNPRAAFAANGVCLGSNTSFTNQSTPQAPPQEAITSWAWDYTSDGTVDTYGPVAAHTFTAAGTYTTSLMVSNYYGCKDTVRMQVMVFANPTITISGGTGICTGGVTTLTASGASSYSWSSGEATATVTLNPATTTPYTVTGTSTAGCIASQTVTVNVGTSIPITVSGSTVACGGAPATLTASGADSYVWSTGPSTATISVSPTSATVYTVTGSAGSTCSGTQTIMVNVSSSPTMAITGNKSICVTGNTSLTASSSSILSYAWSTGDANATISVSPSVTTSYSVMGTSVEGCSSMQTVTVTVNPSPTIAVAGNMTICTGGVATLTASGASSYTWSSGEATATVTLSPGATTLYTVTGISAAGCFGVQTVTVYVNTSIPIAITGNTRICAGGSTSFTVNGASSYTWSTGNSTTTISVSPTTSTVYSVTGSNGSTCSGTQTVMVMVDPSPVIVINGLTNICPGFNATLTASGADTYTWSTGDYTPHLVVAPTSSTWYGVTGTSTAGCLGFQTVTVTVDAIPTLSISGNTSICEGDNTLLTATGATSYTWSTGNPTATVNVQPATSSSYSVVGSSVAGCLGYQTVTVVVNAVPTLSITGNMNICEGSSTTLTVSGAGSYTWSTGNPTATLTVSPLVTTSYSVMGTDVKGCSGSQTVMVTVNPIPPISATGNTLTCLSPTVTLTSTGGGAYAWVGPGILAGENTAYPLVNKPGDYTLTVTHPNGCRNSTIAQIVNQLVDVQAELVADPEKGAAPLTVQFKNNSVNASAFQWVFGDGSGSSELNPQHVFLDEGAYVVYLIAGTGICADTAAVNIKVEAEFLFYIPNSFSPNLDGVNDVFTGKGIGVSKFELWVFDRWGTNIFYSNDIQKGWDGSVKGKEPKQDVYSWKVNITDVNAKKHAYVGHVTLLK